MRLPIAALALTLVLAGGTGPPQSGPSADWVTQSCPSAQIDAAMSYGQLELVGQLDCAADPSLTGPTFGIALLQPSPYPAVVAQLHLYAASAPTTFRFRGSVTWFGTYVCVVNNSLSRLACLGVTRDAAGEVTVAPVDPQSWPVRRPVTLGDGADTQPPTCGTCW